MKKYIDPEKLPKLFREGARKNKSAFLQDENGDALVSLSEVRKALSLATVKEPVRRSYWKKTKTYGDHYLFYECMSCHELEEGGGWKNYCPNCGAKMDGKEERKQ